MPFSPANPSFSLTDRITKDVIAKNSRFSHTGLKTTLWNSTGCRALSTLLNNSIFKRTKELLFSFSTIPLLNHNDENWPHNRQIRIAGRNHILPPLGIENTFIMQS
jgi:hypothetical protein